MKVTGFVLLLIALAAGPAEGQDLGLVRGTILDIQGGAIAGATVTVTCGDIPTAVETDASGRFTIDQLPRGRCVIGAESPGLSRSELALDLTRRPALSVTLVLPLKGFQTAVVVTPGRGRYELWLNLPEPVSVVTDQDIQARPYQLLPQVLREETGILLQQTTGAHTSPIIRGFTGQSNVYLLDGVRFNQSSWRSGPSQYIAWIDDSAIERIEVVRGPGSVQYGSDALGGTINFRTARPVLAAGPRVSGSLNGIFTSADTGAAAEASMLIQTSTAALHLGGSRRHVGDLRAGGGLDSHSAVTRYLGLPSSVLGRELRDTGFSQSGGHVIATVRAPRAASLHALYMTQEQSGASRYDRMLGGEGLFRSGFAPQRLHFGLMRYVGAAAGPLEGVKAAVSINVQDDGRFEQARPGARLDRQQARATSVGYQAEGIRQIGGGHSVSFGGEFYDEYLSAERFLDDPVTGTQPARPDIPTGTGYRSGGLFVQDVTDLMSGRLSLRGGLRYGKYAFRMSSDPAFGVTAERVVTDAMTFHAGAVTAVTPWLSATFSASRGFRSANMADLGGIGLTGGSGFEIAPSRAAQLDARIGTTDGADAVTTGRAVDALRPESVYAFEPGLRIQTRRLTASFTVFDLELRDSIQRRTAIFPVPIVGTTIAGYEIVRQDAAGRAYIAADQRPIATRANFDRVRVRGFDAEGQVRLASSWTTRAFFSLADGSVIDSRDALRRMPPAMGGTSARWQRRASSLWIEGVASFARPQTRLNAGDLSDARIGGRRTLGAIATFFSGAATDLGLVSHGVLLATGETLAQVQARVLGGQAAAPLFTRTPGFVILSARAGWQIHAHLDLTVIGENLTDENYRLHGSGLDGPGFNIQAKLRYNY